MNISSRTPDGIPNRCPICGAEVKIMPSISTRDAPCPSCGYSLWFIVRRPNVYFFIRHRAELSGLLGSRVRIKEGAMENFEGDVSAVDDVNGRITMTVDIFGRPTPVELEKWQFEVV